MTPKPTSTDVAIPSWVRRSGAVAWRLLAVALAVYVVAMLLNALTLLVVPVALALLLTGVLEPVVQRMDRDRLPHWIVPLASVLVVMALLIAVLAVIGGRFAEQLPQLREDVQGAIQPVEDRFGIQLPALPGSGQASDESGSGGGGANAAADGSGGGSGSGGGGTGSGTSSSATASSGATRVVSIGAEILFGAFLAFALAFLFLKDGAAMWDWGLAKLTPGIREDVDAAGMAAWATVGTYVRGLTVVALFDAIGIGAGLLVLGVPLALTLAVLQFIASYVPTIGAFVAGALAVVVAFASGGLVTAALTAALVVVVQQIGNDVVEPWVMGASLPITPLVVLVAVTAGAALWGIAGALLFVPLTAAASAAGHVMWERHNTPA